MVLLVLCLLFIWLVCLQNYFVPGERLNYDFHSISSNYGGTGYYWSIVSFYDQKTLKYTYENYFEILNK